MPTIPLSATRPDAPALEAELGLQALASLSDAQRSALASLGVTTVAELLHYQPIHDARLLIAVADRRVAHALDVDRLLDDDDAGTPPGRLRDLPTAALRRVSDADAQVWSDSLGPTTVGELAEFAPAREAEAFLEAGAFREDPSAPAELMPRAVGSVASRTRLASFVHDDRLDLAARNLELFVDARLSGAIDPRLLDLFQTDRAPQIGLGYSVEVVQEWVSMGTHLGEPVKSIGLAPGESRRIAIVDWQSRVAAQRREDTTAAERLDHELIHQRALDEVTRATAAEHQHGGSQISASTTASALGGVAGGAVAGAAAAGIPAALVGAAVGAAVGTAVPGIGNLAGAAGGAVIGLATGAVVGGIGGAIVAAENAQLGQVEADTSGEREVLTSLTQRVNDVTSQKSSSVRSLWSTVVLSEEQAEREGVQTVAIANYNHAHALTVQYFEVLQHYRAQTRVGRHEALLYLPFRPVTFDVPLIQAYWSVLREGVADASLRLRYDRLLDGFDPSTEIALPDAAARAGLRVSALRVQVLAASVGQVSLQTTGPANGSAFQPTGGGHFALALDEGERPRVDQLRGLGVVGVGTIFGTPTPIGGAAVLEFQAEVTDDDGHVWSVTDRLAGVSGLQVRLDLTEALDGLAADDHAERRLAEVQALADRINQRRYFFTRLLLLGVETEQLTDLVSALVIAPPGGTSQPVRVRPGFSGIRGPIAARADLIARSLSRAAGVPLADLVDPQPLAITGNTLVFRLRRRQPPVDDRLRGLREIGEYLDGLEKDMAAQRTARAAGDDVFLPTNGVFAEAILGRSNSAEKLDGTRHIRWHELPIPHMAGEIASVSLGSRRQDVDGLAPTIPEGELEVQQPTPLPEPATVAGALAALNNGDLFRDMSRTDQLVGVMGRLADLADSLARGAGGLAGAAQQAAVQQAGELAGKVADATAQLIGQQGGTKAPAPQTGTDQGVAANALERLGREGLGAEALGPLERAAARAFGVDLPPAAGSGDGGTSPGRGPGPGAAGGGAPVGEQSGFLVPSAVPQRSDLLPEPLRAALPEALQAVPDALAQAGRRIVDAQGDPAAARAIVDETFATVVRPRLQAANADPASIDDALRALAGLLGLGQLTGSELPAALQEEAFDLAGSALAKALDEANDRLGTGDVGALRRLDELFGAAAAFGLDERAETSRVLGELQASLEIVSLTASRPRIAAGGSVDVTVEAVTRVGGQARPEGASVIVTTAGAAQDVVRGALGADRRFTVTLTLAPGATDVTAGVVLTSALSPLLGASRQLTIPGELSVVFDSAIVFSDPDGEEVGSPLALRAGDGALLNLRVMRGRGPAADAVVRLTLTGAGALDRSTTRTAPTGEAAVEYQAPATGDGVAFIGAIVSDDAGSAAARFDVQFSDG